MIVLRRQGTWPDERRRLHIDWRRLAGLRTPVLVVAAVLFGAAASAAVLVSFWDRETGRRHAVETRLEASNQRAKTLAADNARLRRRVARTTAASVQLEQSATRLRASAQALLTKNAGLIASAGRLHGRGGTLERRAADVSKLAATLGSDLVSVLAYLTNTNAASLDPAYLKAQLDYLKPAVTNVRSAAEALGADADGYATAVRAFAGETAAYAEALRQLADARTSGG